MPPEQNERLATIEATISGMSKTLDRISGYLERSVSERTAQHTETVTRLALIEQSQNTYQENCNADRKAMQADINRLQNADAIRTGKAIAYSSAISLVIGAASFLFNLVKKA